jgi:WD40 repeat protein
MFRPYPGRLAGLHRQAKRDALAFAAAGPVFSVAFSPGGGTLAAGTRNPGNNGGTVQLWATPVSGLLPAANGQAAGIGQPATYTASGMVDSIAFSPDGETLVADAENASQTTGRVQLWNAALVDGNPLGPPLSRAAAIGSVDATRTH